MEDQHNNYLPDFIANLLKENSKKYNTDEDYAFFGVYDGHSGDECAKFLNKNLIETIVEHEPSAPTLFTNDDQIKQSYMAADTKFYNIVEKGMEADSSGATCTSVIIKRKEDKVEVICPNVGDSRSILSDAGKTVPLSFDHKPMNPTEKKRIMEAGLGVSMNRVDGILALSRAFGDFRFKTNKTKSQADQAVSVCPDISRNHITLAGNDKKTLQFLVLACDGIFDVCSNEEVTKFVADRLREQLKGTYAKARMVRAKAALAQNNYIEAETHEEFLADLQKRTDAINSKVDPAAIAEDLIDHVVIKRDSKDNVSATVVLFHSGALSHMQE